MILTISYTIRRKISLLKYYKIQYTHKRNVVYNLIEDHNVLQTRILNLFERQNNLSNLKSTTCFRESLVSDLETKITSIKPYENISINNIDLECNNVLKCLNVDMILYLLCTFAKILPSRVHNLQFYANSIKKLIMVGFQNMNKEQKIQFMFYVSLQKRTKESKIILNKCLQEMKIIFLNKLTPEELAVICIVMFKCSVKIKQIYILNKISDTVVQNNDLFKDSGIIVTYIKSLRHNKYHNESIFNSLSHCIVSDKANIDHYSFTAMSHLMAFYANASVYDEDVFKFLIKKCIFLLQNNSMMFKNTHFTQYIRVKDIARFLWSVSFIGYNLDVSVVEEIFIPNIIKRLEWNEYKNESNVLIDTILSLWILNCKSNKLIYSGLTAEHISAIENSSKYKYKSRLHLLCTCIELELKKKIHVPGNTYKNNNIILRNDLFQQKRISILKEILFVLEKYDFCTKLKQKVIEYQIPHLFIKGITLYDNCNKRLCFIELFDESVCIKNNNTFIPLGLMNLKLRLLSTFDIPIITITPQEINKGNEYIKKYLNSSIKQNFT